MSPSSPRCAVVTLCRCVRHLSTGSSSKRRPAAAAAAAHAACCSWPPLRIPRAQVKCFIAGNAATGFGVFVLLIVTVYRIAAGHAQRSIVIFQHGHAALYVIGTWMLRILFVVFLIWMSATYARLWTLYDDSSDDKVLLTHRGDALGRGDGRSSCSIVHDSSSNPSMEATTQENHAMQSEIALQVRLQAVDSKLRFNLRLQRNLAALTAAFATSVFVLFMLLAAAFVNTAGLWEALAG